MDILNIGIGAIIGAIITVSVNIYLQQRNLKFDTSKERLKNLYNPLNAVIKEKHKYLYILKYDEDNFEKFAVEYYNFFLELRKIYFKNEVYSSKELRISFHTLEHNHFLEYSNYSQKKSFNSNSKEEIYKQVALFELGHKINEENNSQIEQSLDKFIDVISSDIFKINKKIGK